MIILDYRDKRPLYEQVTEKLMLLITGGALSPGDRMPSVRSLALDLSVNPNTVQRAYAQLEQDGYLTTITGRGNYVSEKKLWQAGHENALRTQLKEVLEKVRDGGLSEEGARDCVREVYEEQGRMRS
ncbi:MAG: GntR family transcriptional regulator [Lachnospiraceae bacterium]|nr:GntR family transcriptional regulator [Lachnospiraceae bacterium]